MEEQQQIEDMDAITCISIVHATKIEGESIIHRSVKHPEIRQQTAVDALPLLTNIDTICKQKTFPVNFEFVFDGIQLELCSIFKLAGKRWETYLRGRLKEHIRIAVSYAKLNKNTIAATSNTYVILPSYNKINDFIKNLSISKLPCAQYVPSHCNIDPAIPNVSTKSALPLALFRSVTGVSLDKIENVHYDATILINDKVDFVHCNYDFEAIVTHELGHVLGFVSCVDSIDYNISATKSKQVYITPFDVYRFSQGNTPVTLDDFSHTPRCFSPTKEPHCFSNIDAIYHLSTGSVHGNGHQACHWVQGIGIMDPHIQKTHRKIIRAADLHAMQSIGYGLTVHGLHMLKVDQSDRDSDRS